LKLNRCCPGEREVLTLLSRSLLRLAQRRRPHRTHKPLSHPSQRASPANPQTARGQEEARRRKRARTTRKTATSRSDKRSPTGASEHVLRLRHRLEEGGIQTTRHWRSDASLSKRCKLHPPFYAISRSSHRTVISSRERLRVSMGHATQDSSDLLPA
jgi:hypothetical protein